MLRYISTSLAREFSVEQVSVVLERLPYDMSYANLLLRELQTGRNDNWLHQMLTYMLNNGNTLINISTLNKQTVPKHIV